MFCIRPHLWSKVSIPFSNGRHKSSSFVSAKIQRLYSGSTGNFRRRRTAWYFCTNSFAQNGCRRYFKTRFCKHKGTRHNRNSFKLYKRIEQLHRNIGDIRINQRWCKAIIKAKNGKSGKRDAYIKQIRTIFSVTRVALIN